MGVRTFAEPRLLHWEVRAHPLRAVMLALCAMTSLIAGFAWWALMIDIALLSPEFETASVDRMTAWDFFGKVVWLGPAEQAWIVALGLLCVAAGLAAAAAWRDPD